MRRIVFVFFLAPSLAMAETTLQFKFSPLCAQNNHVDVTATLVDNGSTSTIKLQGLTVSDIKDNPTADDYRTAALIVLRTLVKQMAGNATPLQIKNAIEAKTVDLTIP